MGLFDPKAGPEPPPVHQITPHLDTSEIRCRCGCQYGMFPGEFSPDLAEDFEALREKMNEEHFPDGPEQGLTVSSGCRCHKHNRNMKPQGHPRSHHLRGTAIDIHPPEDVTSLELAALALTIPRLKKGGIGLYDWGLHLDHGRKARWGAWPETPRTKPKTKAPEKKKPEPKKGEDNGDGEG